MNEAWTALQGHVVNGAFPLRRYLGGSDHSGVFLTDIANREPSQVALKLVHISGELADLQLSRWFAASVLDDPQLLRLLDAGRCQVEGLHHVYAVMEYADQNLAELLEHRALTEGEAREMLLPTLSALAFLHGRGLVQGGLKPSNILVVGDGLRLASDTIRPAGEARDGISAVSAHEPPEARDGSWSSAGDIWALGVTLCEALTRRQPSGLREGRVVLPADLSPAFREVIGRCLSREADDRPTVAELEAWLRGEPAALARAPAATTALQPLETIALLEPATQPPVSAERTVPAPPQAAPAVQSAPAVRSTPAPAVESASVVQSASAVQSAPAMPPQPVVSPVDARVPSPPSGARRPAVSLPPAAESLTSARTPPAQPSRRGALPFIVGAVVAFALVWIGLRALETDPAPAPSPSVAETARNAGDQAPAAPPAPVASARAVVPSAPPPAVATPATPVSTIEVHQEIPDVPRRASQTIRGHVKVSIRVIVSQDGTVFAALTEKRGPSRYFERLAIEAAKKWTFTPSDTETQRIVVLRFDFARGHTTARAVIPR